MGGKDLHVSLKGVTQKVRDIYKLSIFYTQTDSAHLIVVHQSISTRGQGGDGRRERALLL